MRKLKQLPKSERPRERLKSFGVQGLSNIELLAIILNTGTRELSVLDLARELLLTLERPSSLLKITLEELMQIKGIGLAKAAVLIASLELYKRLYQDLNKKKSAIRDASDVYYLFESDLNVLEQEHFYCLYLDTKQKIIAKKRLFIGTLNATVITPRDIFKYAIRFNSPAVIFIHNHPSGDPTPSKQDYLATKKLIEGGETIGVKVIDHIIIGKLSCFSIAENRHYYF